MAENSNSRKVFVVASSELVKSIHKTKFKNILTKEVKSCLDARSLKSSHIKIDFFDDTEWKNLDSLLSNLDRFKQQYYYAIVIFSPDDVVKSRASVTVQPRDNVLFEFGLFWGFMGKNRTIVLMPQSGGVKKLFPGYDFKLLSDVGSSINLTKYRIEKKSKGYHADLCDNKIVKAIASKILAHEIKVQNIKQDKLEALTANVHEAILEGVDTISISSFLSHGDELIRGIATKRLANFPEVARNSNSGIADVVRDFLLLGQIDIMDVKQLAERQASEKVVEVWVISEQPLEFVVEDDPALAMLMSTVVEKIKKGCRYRYIVGKGNGFTSAKKYAEKLSSLLPAGKLKKNVHFIEKSGDFFSSPVTIHFNSAMHPDEVIVSTPFSVRSQDKLIRLEKRHGLKLAEKFGNVLTSSDEDGISIFTVG